MNAAAPHRLARRIARLLGSVATRPDAVLSSPKLRAFQTARIVAAEIGVEVVISDRLASALGQYRAMTIVINTLAEQALNVAACNLVRLSRANLGRQSRSCG